VQRQAPTGKWDRSRSAQPTVRAPKTPLCNGTRKRHVLRSAFYTTTLTVQSTKVGGNASQLHDTCIYEYMQVCFVLYCCVMWVVARSTRPFPWDGALAVSIFLLSSLNCKPRAQIQEMAKLLEWEASCGLSQIYAVPTMVPISATIRETVFHVRAPRSRE